MTILDRGGGGEITDSEAGSAGRIESDLWQSLRPARWVVGIAPDQQAGVMAAESEAVGHDSVDAGFARDVGDIVQVATFAGMVEVDRGGEDPVVDGQGRDDQLDAPGGTQEVSELALGAGDLQAGGVGPEDILHGAGLGQVTEWSAAYAVCFLESDRARHDLFIQVTSDDQAKVYLNGQKVYEFRSPRSLVRVAAWPQGGLDTAPVALCHGVNVLVFKVVNETGNWEACLRLIDAEGRPAEGIRVRLTADP